jgi:hypothetical protein
LVGFELILYFSLRGDTLEAAIEEDKAKGITAIQPSL